MVDKGREGGREDGMIRSGFTYSYIGMGLFGLMVDRISEWPWFGKL